ncbi:hypothetical protein JAAARDRAFT_29778 [Jaapia argillacea MUCL 33604]|uniref:Tubby C-terminal domain-containing protein n=1 Tax=Jaapia argillacea MUCL 33604 TaxID=933084 RepID=A0A067QM78_9AGAM|nr:hypothetical protein JAAARDRAFT_29778 [Jaapia argillacea MUCL 33604]
MSQPLAPAPFALGVIPFYTQHPMEIALKIREKKLAISGDDFDITDARSGAVVFKCHGKVFSLHAKKEIHDNSGRHLFTIRNELLHLHSTYTGRDPASDAEIFEIKSSFALGTKLTAKFVNRATPGDREEKLELKGDFFDRKAEITYNGVPVGRISRKFFNMGQVLFDDQTYILTVAPGVDASLLVAFCICLDEKSNDKN